MSTPFEPRRPDARPVDPAPAPTPTGGSSPAGEPHTYTPAVGRLDDPTRAARSAPPSPPEPAPGDEPGRHRSRVRGGRGGRRKGGRRRRDDVMVPDMEFTSYYGHQIVKPMPWKKEIPSYLYLGGLAAGSGLTAAGGQWTGRRRLQRNARVVSLGAVVGSVGALVADLGKPSRFLNMMRTVKLTSPMSVGTWILSAFGGFTGAAFAAEVAQQVAPPHTWIHRAARFVGPPASAGAAAFGPPLAAYTAVLLADTATPTWHGAYRELPFVFVGSGFAAAGGAAMVTTSTEETGPARRLAVGGVLLDLGAHHLMERRLGLLAEPLRTGTPRRLMRASQALMATGAVLAAVGGGTRPLAALAGLALNAGSACTRFAVFEAGIASAKDPKYTVVPQRERIEARRRELEAGDGPSR